VTVDWQRLQQDWDAQQEGYMPDREERFSAMLDAVEAVVGNSPRILDLAGGTGSITLRALERFPAGSSVIVDIDPALLAIAGGTFAADERVRIVALDLSMPDWRAGLGEADESFDVVLTATALHWLTPERVAGVYREAAEFVRPGGMLANADHMPDDGLPELTEALSAFTDARQAKAQTDVADWEGWWDRLRADPEMAEAVAARDARFGGRGGSNHTESTLSSSWHIAALKDAGCTEAGLVWRGLTDAVVVGAR
jgi:SAM-dependent methyltransferase